MTPPAREWRRHTATRLLLATLATALTATSLTLAFLLAKGEDLGPTFAPWQEITGTLLLATYATLCAATSRARLTLDSHTLTVRNLREVAIPLEEIEHVEFRHGVMAIHTATGELHRSLALDGAGFPRFWSSHSRGREAKRAILRAAAHRREETATRKDRRTP